MRRLLALLVAAGLIVAAVIARDAIEGDDDTDGGVVQVTCAIELRAACADLGPDHQVTFEDAAVTADRLATGEPFLDAWVAPRPWPEMVDEVRSAAGLARLFDRSVTVGRSPLVAVTPDATGQCDWRCLTDGTKRLGARRLVTGLGVLELGAAASAHVGKSSFAADDIDGAFRSWLAGFQASIVDSDQPVVGLLQSGADFEVALSFEAEARAALEAADDERTAGLHLLHPAPVAFVDVAVAGAVDLVDGSLPDRVGDSLLAGGWQAPSAEPNGMPRAGVLVALRDELR